jgi:hypothetical protein
MGVLGLANASNFFKVRTELEGKIYEPGIHSQGLAKWTRSALWNKAQPTTIFATSKRKPLRESVCVFQALGLGQPKLLLKMRGNRWRAQPRRRVF